MTGFYIAGLCLLASSKVTLQSYFSKGLIREMQDGILYNGISFAVLAVILFPLSFTGAFSWSSVLFGVAMGLFSMLFQLFYVQAMHTGPVSVTVLINNLAMLFPILVSALCFGEPLGLWRAVGIGLTLVALVLNSDTKGGQGSVRWLIFALLTCLFNGGIAVTSKVYTATVETINVWLYNASAYFCAAVLSGVIYAVYRTKGRKCTFAITPKAWGSASGVAVLLALFQPFNTYVTARVPGTLLFPTYNGAVTLLLALVGRVLYKERFSHRRLVGLAVGLLAIVLMSLS